MAAAPSAQFFQRSVNGSFLFPLSQSAVYSLFFDYQTCQCFLVLTHYDAHTLYALPLYLCLFLSIYDILLGGCLLLLLTVQ